MKLLNTLLILFAFFVVISCNKKVDYPGYAKNDNGFYYKLIKIGDDTAQCHFNDYITADITYQTLKDSVFFRGQRKFRIVPADFKGSIDQCLTILKKGDSASFIISANNFFKKTLSSDLPPFLKINDSIKINIEVEDIQTPESYMREKEAFMKWIEDFGEYEKTLIKQYIEESKLKVAPLKSGMYYLPLKKGDGPGVKVGDTVTFHYEGKFLNGKFFDSTRERKDPFQFVYGEQWQVIKGMEEAIGMMHQGEKALFIMPSELAFGENGSSSGIIPPFTSLIYEVELLSVK
jgi:FKBP-type peptidyl-prolyl cis-trans isomerase FkpA